MERGNMAAQINQNYSTVWDLSCFYDSIDSPEIQNDKDYLSKKIDEFVAKYSGKLSVSNLPDAIYEYDEIYKSALKIETYASLYYQTKLMDNVATATYQDAQEWWYNNFSKLCKFVVEIQNLDYSEIQEKLNQDSKFYQYSAFIEETFRFRKHTLSANEESIIAKMGLVTGNAWHKFHEGILSRIEFQFEDKKLTLSDIVEKANYGESDEIRKNASIALSLGLKNNSYALISVFNNVTLSHQVYGEIKKYENPESQRFLADNIDKKAVETMVDSISENYKSICHRYYKIKAKLLGKDKLQYWDRCSNVKISNTPDVKFSYDEAIDLILSIFKGFSEKFYKIANEMVNNSWVDVYPKDGKVSGAFACPATVDFHPFILLNFYGSMRDVLTIAHEFGHGIHQKLSMRNNELVANPALNISETASTFAEKLTNKYLLENEHDPKKKIELICSRLDDVMSTVFRQIAFFKFEQKIHNLRKEKELSSDIMDNAWREVLSESLGDGVKLEPSVNNFWGYITHFTNCPFYVYSYAFGCLFVEGLFAEYEKNGADFIEKYEEILSCGGTKTYSEIANMFGIDANSKEFWNSALNSIKSEIDELEALCDLAIFN